MITEDLKQRFEAKWKRDEQTGCWLWTASTAGNGYGQIKLPNQRKQVYAHRLSYQIHKGQIPKGIMVCHVCDTLLCVNPDHLFLGTSKENQQDMKRKGRSLFGTRNTKSRLTEREVLEIYSMLNAGISQRKIAKVYGVHQVSISKINRSERWQHLSSYRHLKG